MCKNYTITLTPVGNFFFGGEDIHQSPQKSGDDTMFYLSISNPMPQQTALLGMLRFALLSTAGDAVFKDNKIVNTKTATELIGGKSFCKGTDKGDFGKIKSLGACGLQIRYADENPWYPLQFAAFDNGLTVEVAATNNDIELDKDCWISIKGYVAKDGLNFALKARHGEEELRSYRYDDIFRVVPQVGINRNIRTGLVEANAFYKQHFYRLASGYKNDEKNIDEKFTIRFCFNAQLDIDEQKLDALNGLSVQLGSDDSRFILNIKECPEATRVIPVIGGTSAIQHVTLQSDAYLTPEEARISPFNISDVVAFRSLSTYVADTTNYYSRNEKTGAIKSVRSYLYKRGSVFYFADDDQRKNFITALESRHPDFFQIGYNQYE